MGSRPQKATRARESDSVPEAEREAGTRPLVATTSGALLHAGLEKSHVGCVAVALDGVVLDANNAFLQMIGRTRGEVIGSRSDVFAHPDDRQLARDLMAGRIEEYLVTRRMCRQGKRTYLEIQGVLVRDARNEPAYLFAQVRDISERIRSERTKDEFFALVSHEFRTPLASIIGYVELLADLERAHVTEEGSRFLTGIERNAHRLMRLVDSVLAAARIEAGTLELHPTRVDIAPIVEGAVAAARPDAAQRKLSLHVRVDPACPPIDADLERIEQVIDNLLSNAVKFTPEGGTVTVRLHPREHGSGIALVIHNSGPGIPDDERSRIFERFYRDQHARDEAKPGVGLGLSICRAIVEGHGGRIEVTSATGKGITFTVLLPRSISNKKWKEAVS